MNPAPPPRDMHRLTAALGWIELRAPENALAELDSIGAQETRKGSLFLDIHWRTLAALNRWPDSLPVARKLRETAPESAMSWIHLSYSLHELGDTNQARENLLEAAALFPEDGTIPYNLACYENQLARPAEALRWIARAIQRVGKQAILEAAHADPDLLSLWPSIRNMGNPGGEATGIA